MPSRNSDHLVALILSLTKSEKKNFRLMAKKAGRSELLYEKLYAHIVHYKGYDEKLILKKLPELKKSQLANLRANLYKAILRSLRDVHKESYLEIKAREQYDFAKILYSKGNYRASLDMLQKVKSLASRIHQQPLQYVALSFEKHIESQHVTGSMSPKALELERESIDIIVSILVRDKLSNLSLLMYGKYLQLGIIRSADEKKELDAYFYSKLPDVVFDDLDFYQRLYLYQAYVWYHRMLQDFAKCYRYAQRWVDLFESNPEMKNIDTVTYIKGLHNVLNPLYLSGKHGRFRDYLDKLIACKDGDYVLSINDRRQLDLFVAVHSLELIILEVDYENGATQLDSIEDLLEEGSLDLHRQLSLRYLLACVYFGAGNHRQTLTHLNILTNNKYADFKEDIQCFGRILKLLTHFDMGDDELVVYEARSVYRFLTKMKELQAPQVEILRFIRKIPNTPPSHMMDAFMHLKERLVPYESDPIERRTFLYLDIISWLDSKIKGITMAEAIRARRM